MYLELSTKDFFKSFKSPRRISNLLAEGFSTGNCFLVGAATEELASRGEEAIVAVILKNAVEARLFKINSPLAANFSEVLSSIEGYSPILRAIYREMCSLPQDRLWVKRAVAAAVEPSRSFQTDQELSRWFLEWQKDDEFFASYQAPASTRLRSDPIPSDLLEQGWHYGPNGELLRPDEPDPPVIPEEVNDF